MPKFYFLQNAPVPLTLQTIENDSLDGRARRERAGRDADESVRPENNRHSYSLNDRMNPPKRVSRITKKILLIKPTKKKTVVDQRVIRDL